MYKGYQEADEHQKEHSADTAAAVDHGGYEGWRQDRAKRLQKLLEQRLQTSNSLWQRSRRGVQASARVVGKGGVGG